MDATELIEEAGRWAKNVRESPGNGTAGEDLYLAGLLDKLIAALRESEERAKAAELDAASLRAAWKIADRTSLTAECQAHAKTSFDLLGVVKERDALAAANLAANKRIVELEHDRAAALAELAQPYICPNCTAKLRRLDRMDSAGHAAYELDKARKDAAGQNKRAQKAEQEAKALRAELARLTTPRPIAEAPRDGRDVLVLWIERDIDPNVTPEVMHWDDDCAKWMRGAESEIWEQQPTHYVPLPNVKP